MVALPSLEDLVTRLDLTNFGPAHLDLSALTDTSAARAARAGLSKTAGVTARVVREATYISVGLTLLGIQRAQVRRRGFERSLRR